MENMFGFFRCGHHNEPAATFYRIKWTKSMKTSLNKEFSLLNGCINEVFSNKATSLIRLPTVGPEGGCINEVSLYWIDL